MPLKLPFGRSNEPVCYEVRLAINASRSDEFDAWLEAHVREMLAFPGFDGAKIFRSTEADDEGRDIRIVAYSVRTRRELDSYLHTHAARMRKEGVSRFGKDLEASRNIVPLKDYREDPSLQVILTDEEISGGLPICGNCHRPVAGRYCANCGQEDRTYLFSLGELLHELFGELTDFDSRFFRSLKPLLFKPGWLTVEYIRGRRQHYFPPVRTYIIISLLFFFVAAVMTGNGLQNADVDIFNAPGSGNISTDDRREAIREIESRLENADGTEREVLQSLLADMRAKAADDGDASGEGTGEGIQEMQPGSSSTAEAEPTGDDTAASDPEPDEAAVSEWKWPSIRIDDGKATASGWGSESLNQRMARGAQAIKENPRAFVRTLVDNIPSMMFIFLPLIALALKILYLFSRRYYVEHLMFSLHIHSAVFLILLFWMMAGELADAWTPLDRIMGWITAAVWIYIPVYLYKSMRRVYGQGHFMTSIKFFMLSIFYIVAASITSVFLFIAAVYQQA